jgi:hypothetical protein
MAPVTLTTQPDRSRSRLRLIGGERRHAARRPAPATEEGADASVAMAGANASVLIAGADAPRRARMMEELRGLLPGGTPFEEASETWQVLAKAGKSAMVILTGELGDVSAQGLMRVLSRRYPLLPVIALGAGHGATDDDRAGIASLR